MKIAYFLPEIIDQDSDDGGYIYHRKLLEQLREHAEEVVEIQVKPGVRRSRIPLWSERISPAAITSLAQYADQGFTIVISHERIFKLAMYSARCKCPAHLIVHNYIPRFQFNGRPLLGLAYRTGARQYFDHAFRAAKSALFLGASDMRAALKKHREDSTPRAKFVLSQIPPASALVNYRFDQSLLHFSGSEAWLPKRLSRLSALEKSMLNEQFVIRDYFEVPVSGFTLIADKFDVGFKLKLMQAIYFGDYIASFVDLSEEVRAISPNYRWYCTCSSISEFIKIAQDETLIQDVQEDERSHLARETGKSFTWSQHGEIVLTMLQ